MTQGSPQNQILGEKPRRERRAGDRQGRHDIRPIRRGHVSFEPAHLAHILFAVQRMDHAA